MGLPAPVAVWPPRAELVWSGAVAVYEVMGDPPSEAGGLKGTGAEALPAVAATLAGGPGTVAGARAIPMGAETPVSGPDTEAVGATFPFAPLANTFTELNRSSVTYTMPEGSSAKPCTPPKRVAGPAIV